MGGWGLREPNMKGLREFMSRVPALRLECIQDLTIEFHLLNRLWEISLKRENFVIESTRRSLPKGVVDTWIKRAQDTLKDFKTMMTAASRMKGLRSVRILAQSGEGELREHFYQPRLHFMVSDESDNMQVLCSAVRDLGALRLLKKVDIVFSPEMDIGKLGAVQIAVEETEPEMAKVLTLSKSQTYAHWHWLIEPTQLQDV